MFGLKRDLYTLSIDLCIDQEVRVSSNTSTFPFFKSPQPLRDRYRHLHRT